MAETSSSLKPRFSLPFPVYLQYLRTKTYGHIPEILASFNRVVHVNSQLGRSKLCWKAFSRSLLWENYICSVPTRFSSDFKIFWIIFFFFILQRNGHWTNGYQPGHAMTNPANNTTNPNPSGVSPNGDINR